MINVLLITGANNHDWQRSSPFLKAMLEKSGKFAVDMTTEPAKALADRAGLAKYQLFFSDYNSNDRWGEPAETNFLDAVRGGAGVVILHAANNAFPGWEEYEKLCALCWREGTGHGKFHKLDVSIIEREHPIMKGLTDLKEHPDELYHRLVHMHDAPYQILADAISEPAFGGMGTFEPVVVVTHYGKGRVFHNTLGHVWAGGDLSALEDPQFQKLTLRGAEWAATGAVTG